MADSDKFLSTLVEILDGCMDAVEDLNIRVNGLESDSEGQGADGAVVAGQLSRLRGRLARLRNELAIRG